MKNKIAYILLAISMLLISTGLLLKCIDLNNELNKTKKQMDLVVTENNKLKAENESLWDNYYMNVTKQDGEEYYE